MDSAGTVVRPAVATPLDRRDVRFVGRKARLELVFTRRGERTCLSHAYAEPPYRVGRYFSDGADARLMLVWVAPGVFGGDDFEQHVRVERGARVHLTSQSALQVHPANGVASLRGSYEVDSGAFLSCHWDPMIPFAGASLDQKIVVTLAPDAALYWSDGLMAGREARGERWAFEKIRHELRVVRDGGVEYLERYQLTAGATRLADAWAAADACYFGTVVSSGLQLDAADAERIHCELQRVEGVRAAADALATRLLLVRLMANAGVPFHEARALARDALAGKTCAVYALDHNVQR